MAKANYDKPTSQMDLEARQKKDYVPASQLVTGDDREKSDNGFVGVDPVYQNFANETDKPLVGDSGPEAKIHREFLADDVDFGWGATPEGESVEDDEGEGESTPNTPSTPASGN